MAVSEYGLNIYNYQAGSVYAVMNGARNNYHYHRAMLTNSLFLDFLSQNGLKVSKNGYTRDVIGVEFDYGSRSADEELEHLEKLKQRKTLLPKLWITLNSSLLSLRIIETNSLRSLQMRSEKSFT